ncbi:FHA domain-containing protein [Pseudomonas sp. PSKL.D1]|uniref:FHA domain-containing protein n=1 Tax=Pseudomonas sp. PSKL.D1 TaxID=3029060 RepID=UPI0023817B49|nr:FHA domain-containing protein [Pseudomonas sp. PSKL.D1]WDY56607.1 FHA domain-containing protein [Pseudomonas sp. PSKL.D1]
MSTLSLRIVNPDQLQHGSRARHRFDQRGGTIGSDKACWRLIDHDRQIAPIHCEIRWIEGRFCVIDHSNQTYLNDERQSLGPRNPRSLRNGDRLQLGSCCVQVRFEQGPPPELALRALLNAQPNALDALLAEPAAGTWQPDASDAQPIADICSVFTSQTERDPLKALDAATAGEASQQDPLQCLITGKQP